MTKEETRDLFAAAALIGFLVGEKEEWAVPEKPYRKGIKFKSLDERMAEEAFILAAAMMDEREVWLENDKQDSKEEGVTP